MQKKFK